MITGNAEETRSLGAAAMKGIVPGDRATIVELSGELGAGKTTFMQGIGEYFGLGAPLVSPTFVIAKHYDLPTGFPWKRLIHIDAYRIEDAKELDALGWEDYAADPGNIIFIEWPGSMHIELGAVKRIEFKHINENQREIKI